MGFEELFENKRKSHGNYGEHSYHDDNRYTHDSRHSNGRHNDHSYGGHEDNFRWLEMLAKIRNNKKLRLFIIAGGMILLTLTITLVIALFPLITKLFTYISQNGLQGVMDGITGFVDKILKGSAK